MLQLTKNWIEARIRDSIPEERIPFFELLLTSGSNALSKRAGYPENLIRVFLKYAPGSDAEIFLLSFLDVCPPHEQSVTLAYLLSQSGKDKSSTNAMAEVFQSVGIKGAQLNSILKVIGSTAEDRQRIATENEELKDDAKPLSLYEIREIARKTLTPEEFAKIKEFVKIEGSASMKTVVSVRFHAGVGGHSGESEGVMYVARPHAKEQVRSNIALLKALMLSAKERGLKIKTQFFQVFLDALEEQLLEEGDLRLDAQRMIQAREAMNRVSHGMTHEMEGWTFSVPQVFSDDFQVRENLYFAEKVSGEKYSELPEGERIKVGRCIVKSNLRLFTEEGLLDGDRHNRQCKFNRDKKIIYTLDFGQLYAFQKTGQLSWDDRLTVVEFAQALKAVNAAGFLDALKRMATPSSLGSFQEQALIEAIPVLLSKCKTFSAQDWIFEFFDILSDVGLVLQRKYAFGLVKGTLMLWGENYVSSSDFTRMVAEEFERFTTRRKPIVWKLNQLKVKARSRTKSSNICPKILQP